MILNAIIIIIISYFCEYAGGNDYNNLLKLAQDSVRLVNMNVELINNNNNNKKYQKNQQQ